MHIEAENEIDLLCYNLSMIGTLINVVTVTIGSLIGLVIRKGLSKRFEEMLFQVVGVFTIGLGVTMSIRLKNPITIILSLLSGSLIGEALKIDLKLNSIVQRISVRFEDSRTFTRGLVLAFLTYCVGPMTILGAINDGMGDSSLLIVKAIMDGFVSIAYASSLGIGVLFSVIPLFLYQGSITLLAFLLKNYLVGELLENFTATGGIILIALALELLGLKKMKVLNMLPSLFMVIPLDVIVSSCIRGVI